MVLQTFERSSLRLTVATVLALATVLVGASASVGEDERPGADIPGNVTGGDVTAPGDQIDDSRGRERLALFVAREKESRGEISAAELGVIEDRYRENYGADSAATSSPLSPPPASRILRVKHYPQRKNFYCGPAAGLMLIKMANGSIRSRFNGAVFNQASLATAAHMNTDVVGATRWASGRFTLGVNRWRGSNSYMQLHAPSNQSLQHIFRNTVGLDGLPFGAGTVEYRNGPHYNGHPRGQEIGHWITGYGYTSSGYTGRYADPATSVWSGVARTFQHYSVTFIKYLNTNGVSFA